MAARTPQRQQLMELLGPVITSQGYDLEDLSVTAAGRRSVIRVIVDSDTGIDLDGVAEVSRAVSEILDAEAEPASAAAFSGPYVLEVSSPGVDRPLTEPRHWRRAVGRLVSVAISDQSVTGRVLAGGEDGIVLEVDGVKINHSLSELGPGRIQVEFAHADDHKEA
ncbi:MAG: ribosome maturation factor RimP [Pseudonocardiales bacterium]|nr:ribosome maturation factor RimP [Pseudonocardiales bacterium]